jgi:arylsulfatase A-like enzyme
VATPGGDPGALADVVILRDKRFAWSHHLRMPPTLDRRAAVLGTAACLAALSTRRATGADGIIRGRRPNIVFILADDLGVADCSCYGAPQIRTPAIDSLATDGALFSQAYANSAVCTASRVGIITGRYQYRLSVGLEEPLARTSDIGLPPEQPTLPSLLKRLGYDTYLVGKWHLGSLPKFDPLKSGYGHFYGFEAGSSDYFIHPGLREDHTFTKEPGYLTDLLGARAVKIIAERTSASKPFLLSLHFNAPHWPWEGPGDEAESRRLAQKRGDPNAQFDFDGGTLDTYRQMVEAMDRQIGMLLATLKRTGLANDTIVLFTSDNGGERFSNTWPFSGKKQELLEGGLRVPAVIRWPEQIKPGTVLDQVAIHMDWLPTFIAAAGSSPDPASPPDGMNLLPTLLGQARPISRTLYWRYKANAQRAVRDGDYKALKIAGNTFLFDVVKDPLERANLKDRYPQIYAQLTQKWNLWNTTMLPEDPRSQTDAHDGAHWADHTTAHAVDPSAIDDGGPWPTSPGPTREPAR